MASAFFSLSSPSISSSLLSNNALRDSTRLLCSVNLVSSAVLSSLSFVAALNFSSSDANLSDASAFPFSNSMARSSAEPIASFIILRASASASAEACNASFCVSQADALIPNSRLIELYSSSNSGESVLDFASLAAANSASIC